MKRRRVIVTLEAKNDLKEAKTGIRKEALNCQSVLQSR